MPGPVSGEVSFRIHFKNVCGPDPSDPKKAKVVCGPKTVVIPEKSVPVTTSEPPKDNDAAATCRVVTDIRKALANLLDGLKNEREKLKPSDKLVPNSDNEKYKELTRRIRQIRLLLFGPNESHSMETEPKTPPIDKEKSHAEFTVSKPKTSSHKIPINLIWNPNLVCKESK